MVVLVLIGLWVVVLAPGVVRRLRERQPTESIDSFHQQLHLLERTGPKLVEPAYRLESVQSHTGVAVGQSGFPSVSSRPGRPNLVLLRPVGDGGATGRVPDDEVIDEVSGAHYRRLLPADPDGTVQGEYRSDGAGTGSRSGRPPVSGRAAPRSADVRHRHQARRRRRSAILWTSGTLVATAFLGFVPPLHELWVVTGLAALGLTAYVGLVAYAQMIEADRYRPASPPRRLGGYSHDDASWLYARDPGGPAVTGERAMTATGWSPGTDGSAEPDWTEDGYVVADGTERAWEYDERRVALGR
ncbi:MAG: hypothetical protein ACYDHU_10990 [Acidimicrobiales bacterium]